MLSKLWANSAILLLVIEWEASLRCVKGPNHG
jgi:hypothetical protein